MQTPDTHPTLHPSSAALQPAVLVLTTSLAVVEGGLPNTTSVVLTAQPVSVGGWVGGAGLRHVYGSSPCRAGTRACWLRLHV